MGNGGVGPWGRVSLEACPSRYCKLVTTRPKSVLLIQQYDIIDSTILRNTFHVIDSYFYFSHSGC